jgi:hypothetical protein
LKKLIIAGTAVAVLGLAGTAAAVTPGPIPATAGVEGCVVVGSAGGATCTYNPTSAGGFVGNGNFTITLTFADTTKAPVTLTSSAQQGCAQWTNGATGAKYTGVASATVNVADNQSAVAAGQPVPAPLQAGAASSLQCS